MNAESSSRMTAAMLKLQKRRLAVITQALDHARLASASRRRRLISAVKLMLRYISLRLSVAAAERLVRSRRQGEIV